MTERNRPPNVRVRIRARAWVVLIVLVVLLVAACYVTYRLASSGHLAAHPSHQFQVSTILMFLFFSVGIAVRRLWTARSDFLARFDAAAALGMHFVSSPTEDDRRLVSGTLGHIRMVEQLPNQVRWLLIGLVDQRFSLLVCYGYTLNTGHAMHSVTHMISAASCPRGWPELRLSLTRSPGFVRTGVAWVRRRLGLPSLALESEPFTNKWKVECDSDDFALCFLTPSVQAWLEDSPEESWLIGNGVACCIRSKVKNSDLVSFARRPHQLLSLVPEEVHKAELVQ